MSTDVLLSDIAAKRDLTEVEARGLVDSIRVDIEDVGVRIATAYLGRAWVALGHPSWDTMCAAEFDGARLRVPREQRVEQVQSLRSAGLSTRAIGAALGVHHATVAADLRPTVGNPTVEPTPVRSLDGRTRPATQPVRAPMPEPVTADTTTGEVTDPGDVPFEQWQEQNGPLPRLPRPPADEQAEQDDAAMADSLEAHMANTDIRYLGNLFRGITTTQHVLLDLDPARAIEVCREREAERASLLAFIARNQAWMRAVQAGLGRNLRSVR